VSALIRPLVRRAHRQTLDRLGEKYQERTYLGHGDFEFGERLYLFGADEFSYDEPAGTVLSQLLECVIAIRHGGRA
jgi:hypothetical protein